MILKSGVTELAFHARSVFAVVTKGAMVKRIMPNKQRHHDTARSLLYVSQKRGMTLALVA